MHSACTRENTPLQKARSGDIMEKNKTNGAF